MTTHSRIKAPTIAVLIAALSAFAVQNIAQARSDREREETQLVPTADGPLRAYGEIEIERRSNRLEFKVEIEDVTPGAYDLYVNDILRGVLNAVPVPGGVEGELEFRDPPQQGKVPLDFDPIGSSVEIRQDGITILSGISPSLGGSTNTGNGNGNGNSSSPASDFSKQKSEAFLYSTDEFPPARGDMKLKVSKKKAKLVIKTLALPAGVYDVCFDGIPAGTITSNGRNGKGIAKFSSSPGGNDQTMSFNPVGAAVQITRGGAVYLEGMLDGESIGGGFSNPGIAETALAPTSLSPGASGDLEYKARPDRTEFKVEIEDVPVGTYLLLIDGVEVASFDVVNTATGPEGEIEFRNPVEPGKTLLDFDPLGALIQITNLDGDVLLGAEFPASPAGL